MNTLGRGFIAGFVGFQLLLFAHASPASAVKPVSPLAAECSTLSSAGMVYKARCVIKDVAGTPPDSVGLAPITDEAVSLVEFSPPQGGIGEWFFTLAFKTKKTVVIPFVATYKGSTLHVGAKYDPFNLLLKEAPTHKGRMVKNKDASTLNEHMSK